MTDTMRGGKDLPFTDIEREYHAAEMRRHAQLVEQAAVALEQNDQQGLLQTLNVWSSPVHQLRADLYREHQQQRGISSVTELFQPSVPVPIATQQDIDEARRRTEQATGTQGQR